MKGLKKGVVITVVLLLPVLVFLFLKQYGSNEFDLPVYYLEGNSLAECHDTQVPYIISESFITENSLKLPMLIHFKSEKRNEYLSDLDNVLQKYSGIGKYIISSDTVWNNENSIILTPDEFTRVLNCELVMGEDQYLSVPIELKYVLIDTEKQIRGYFQLDELDEIVRLDMELDILLNY